MDDDITPIIDPDSLEEEGNICQGGTKENDVDRILAVTGGFGRFQILMLLLCMFLSNSFSYQTLSMYFAADDPPWQCITNSSDFCTQHLHKSIPESSDHFAERCNLNRSEWMYTVKSKYSFVTEFDLVCTREYLKALTTSVFFIGASVGSIVCGPLSDVYGRKLVICLVMFLMFVASISCSFITSVWEFIFLRVLIGFAFAGSNMCVYILVSEFTAPKRRGIISNVYFFGYTASMLLLSLTSFYVREWRSMLLYASLPSGFGFMLSLGLYESPYWLNAKGKTVKAFVVLQKIASINRKVVKIDLRNAPQADATKKNYSYLDFFRNLQVFILVLVQCVLWFVVGLMFYGIALESSNLGGSIYLNFVLSSMADIPGYIGAILSSIYIGRKITIGVSFLIPSVLICVIGIISESDHEARVALAVSSRTLLTIAFTTMFLWSFEIFPTVLRAQGMNICQITSRIGSAAAPFITEVLKDVNPSLPFYIMGGLGILSALLGMLLPETNKKPTRETYDDFFTESRNKVVADDSKKRNNSIL